jgi:hypothetical protein
MLRIAASMSVLLLLAAGPALAAEWEKVFDRSGAFADSTAGGGRVRSAAATQGPFAFNTTGKGMRIKWTTETDGRNPDFRIEIEQLIKLGNGGTRWQRVATIGRTHESVKEGAALNTSPGNYRISLIGHAMKYTVLVESPKD